ncbi:MAG: hypothetical protein WBB37_04360 [bacterium]
MKKLFAIAIAASMLSGLYGLSLGLGVAYEDVAEDGRYLCIKGDMRVPILPIVDLRGGLLNVMLPDGGKAINFGTCVSSDLLIKFPMPASFQPYLVLGVWFNLGLEDAPGDYMDFSLKAGLGGEMGFGGFNAYLEGGLHNFKYVKDADPSTTNPIYVQLGVTFPVGM